VSIAAALVLAYLLGSIPFAYLAGRVRGVDLRTVGSGNLGATNVFRTLGRSWGIGVMVLDIAKGLAAVLIARALTDDPWPLAAAGLAIAGHVFPVWLRFKGGKGVAVAAGAMLGLMPLVAAVLVPAWFVVVVLTRYVSVASIACAVACTPLAALFGYPWSYVGFAALASAAVLVRHRGNIQRLLRGTENRISLGRGRAPVT
jgi:glycerol-3-phosphate acyltransferase PlsY